MYYGIMNNFRRWVSYLREKTDRRRYYFFRSLSGLEESTSEYEQTWNRVPWRRFLAIKGGLIRWNGRHFFIEENLSPEALAFQKESGRHWFEDWEPWMVSGAKYTTRHGSLVTDWVICRIDMWGNVYSSCVADARRSHA